MAESELARQPLLVSRQTSETIRQGSEHQEHDVSSET